MPLSRINAQSLTDASIVSAEIADGAITTAKLADNAVTTAKVNPTQTDITSVGTLTSFRSTGIDDNADALAMTIDSSERVLVGTTNAVIIGNGGIALKGSDGRIDASGGGGPAALFDRRTNDGDIVGLYKDGTAVGMIQSRAGAVSTIVLDPSSTGGGISGGGSALYPTDHAGTLSNGALTLGDASYRWNNLYLAGGVFLGGTGSANELTDYEEGTWTPTFTDGSNTGTLNSPSGFYTKIGNMVIADYSYSINGIGSLSGGSTAQVGGLPFTAVNDFTGAQGSVRSQGIGGANNLPIVSEVLQNTTRLRYHFASGTATQLVVTVNQFSQNDFVAGQMIYKV